MISENKVVSLSYQLVVDGDVIETVKDDKPMQFIFGQGYLLPAFEEQVRGKQVGDNFDFTLSAKDGYGEVDPNAIVELSKDIFKKPDGTIDQEQLVKDRVLRMQDSEGHILNGVIDQVNENSVIMNFNHPLAGCALHFTGKVVDVREATEKELTNGLYGERAASSCGHDCSGCSGCH